jgi:two-component system, LuxR family, sensor kinase FixL
VRWARVDDAPAEATSDRAAVAALGIRSLFLVPFTVGGTSWAFGCVALRAERPWPDELIQRFRLLTDVFANVLGRRRAERAMRESEERFRVLADGAPLMIWMSSTDGRRTYFNRRWLDVVDCAIDEAEGNGWLSRVHPDDRDFVTKTIGAAVENRRAFTVDYRVRRGDGEQRWVIDHGVPRSAEDGTLVGYIGSGVDVTDLKAAQEALLESNALRSAIFGSLAGHVAAIDRDGTIIAVNDSWLRLAEEHGADPSRVSVGANYFKVCQTVGAMTDSQAWNVRAAVAEVLTGGSNRAQLEYLSQGPSGDRWFDLTVEPFRRPEGGAVVFHVDVTRRRQAEDEAQRQREDLAHTLRVTTLGELAASLAHEINQPLAAIVTNAQAIIRLVDADRAATGDVRGALGDIASDGKRASDIIRRLRALFRKEHIPSQLVDVNERAADAVSLVHYDLRRRGITIVSAYEPGLPAVAGDPVQLQQVLLNLLINASEAIVAAASDARAISITTASRDRKHVEIAIRDTGVGVPSGDLERMFDRFVSTKPDGLGMGLAISRSIVQAHAGRIWATLNPDRGLTMHVELPAEVSPPS